MAGCLYCGSINVHAGLCPRIQEIEYHPNGVVKRLVFYPVDRTIFNSGKRLGTADLARPESV